MTTSLSEKRTRNILGCNEDRSMVWIHVRAGEGGNTSSFKFKKTDGDMFEIDFLELLGLWCESASPREIARMLSFVSKKSCAKDVRGATDYSNRVGIWSATGDAPTYAIAEIVEGTGDRWVKLTIDEKFAFGINVDALLKFWLNNAKTHQVIDTAANCNRITFERLKARPEG